MLSKKSLSSLLMMSALILCSGYSTQAQAQDIDMEEVKEQLRHIRSVSEENLNEALKLYLELRTKFGGANLEYSIGRTYQKLYQCEDAQDMYMRIMSTPKYEGSDAYLKAIDGFDEIASCTTWQKVTINCTSATTDTLIIDDVKIGDCGNRPYTLPDGEHTIKLVSTSGKEKSITVTTETSGDPISVDLAIDVEPTEEICGEYVSIHHPPKEVEVEVPYEYQDRFHPALYWGLIAGGVLVLAGGSGWSAAMANNALVDVQKYEDIYAFTKNDADKKKADDARDKVNLGNTLLYTSLGVGGALTLTGVALAIVSAVSPKEKVNVSKDQVSVSNVNAFVTPNQGGASMGLGFNF